MCMNGLVDALVQLMMLAKPRTKLIRTNRNAYYLLMPSKVSERSLNRIYRINLDKNTCKLY